MTGHTPQIEVVEHQAEVSEQRFVLLVAIQPTTLPSYLVAPAGASVGGGEATVYPAALATVLSWTRALSMAQGASWLNLV